MLEYILYRLDWNPGRGKYDKVPCRLDGSSLSRGETPPRADHATATRALSLLPPEHYALGAWIAPPYFFIDLDACVVNGQLTDEAAAIVAPFVAAGCYYEASWSGNGVHVIGRYTGQLPEHSNRRPSSHKHEFYTRDRGCALSRGGSMGSMDVDATGALLAMLPEVFPPRAAATLFDTSQRRPEWRGPEDDDILIQRALSARGSAKQQFGGGWTFSDLWSGNVPDESRSEADLALASHLAFWTGCDAPRIERLMRRSGLMRPKWNEHRTYLSDITIQRACATTAHVYQEPIRQDVVTAALGAPSGDVDWNSVVEATIARINDCGSYADLMDQVIPSIGPLGIPPLRAERVVSALQKRLALFDGKVPVGQLRRLVCPPVAAGELVTAGAQPDWIGAMCYVKRTDRYFNTLTGSDYSAEGLRVEFNRFMPFKQAGGREDVVAWARDRWNIVTVDDVEYRPDESVYFDFMGKQFANTFRPSTMPALAQPSPECSQCIQLFQQHLYLLCGKRDDIYAQMLYWIAHNVQFPGRKIRWSPVIKGVHGDGKGVIAEVMRYALGLANVKTTSISTLANSGGFTDWALGAAVNVIEEIRLEGKDKRKLYNGMKIFISERIIDLNKKGKVSSGVIVNVTNHIAFTNHADAIPIEDGERRWLVLFTPYTVISDAFAERGVSSEAELVAYFERIGQSVRAEPGAWRAWLSSIDCSGFNPNSRALSTPEREAMQLMSSDTLDQTVMDIIEQGGHGINKQCFSSSCLAGMVTVKYGDRPHDRGWNALLVRLGYRQLVKTVWWSGTAHRIWAKKEMTADEVRSVLGSPNT